MDFSSARRERVKCYPSRQKLNHVDSFLEVFTNSSQLTIYPCKIPEALTLRTKSIMSRFKRDTYLGSTNIEDQINVHDLIL